jgi:lysophospholipase L1-like esterase|tara:strand:- start:29854 stop:30534 length:681 start_codon:yes stop_codon:yes gene_type:complete
MRILAAKLSILLLMISALCANAKEPIQVLVMGDSFMTSNGSDDLAVPDLIERHLGAQVQSRAATGARFVYKLPITGALGLNISKQYRPGRWDWVVMNGGGNDLWLGCGCTRCKDRLNRLISPDGTRGYIPALVARARRSGAQVLYVGYLRSPGVGSPIEHCRAAGDALEARVAVMAKRDGGVSFVSLADMVPHGDRSFHAGDMIHPSAKGSQAATTRIVEAMMAVQ